MGLPRGASLSVAIEELLRSERNNVRLHRTRRWPLRSLAVARHSCEREPPLGKPEASIELQTR